MSAELLGKPPSTADVRAMYEMFPYPSPVVGDSFIDDVVSGLYPLFGENPLKGRRILDAGCGTGHRLLGVATRYPDAEVVGVDMTTASLNVARELARKHNVKNVQFEQADILDLSRLGKFDLVICTGVLVCLEDARKGLQSLSSRLTEEGILFVWLYHPVGEYARMLDREMLQIMWKQDDGLQHGVAMMRELGLNLDVRQYGSASAVQRDSEVSQLNISVDAYIHPIVNLFTLNEGIDLFRGCPDLGWAAIHSVNMIGDSKLVDLADKEHPDLRCLCEPGETVFNTESMRRRFAELDTAQKLRVLELKLRPTGFTVVGGRNRSYAMLGPRIEGNAVQF